MKRLAFSRLSIALVLIGLACGKNSESSANGTPPAAASGKSGGGSKTKNSTPAAIPVAPSRGPEHAVYSLIDNRASAHLQRKGGLVIPAGSAGFAKYLRFRKSKLGWTIRAEKDGKKVAIMDGTVGRIDVPLTAEQIAGSPALRMRVHSEQGRALSIRINGQQKKEVSGQVEAGWSTVELTVPGDLFRAGENEILIFAGKGKPMAIEWLQIAGQSAGDDVPVLLGKDGKSLALPGNGGASYYVMVPDKGLVTGDLDDARCKVAIKATADGGKQVTGELVGKGSAVELGALAGQPVRLDLTATGCETARLGNAALVVPGKEPAFERGPAPKHVVLWIMDSLRADRVKPFNPKARPDTPTFEKLAESSAMFMQTYVQGNESRVSHASIWSSLYPVKHDMLSPKAKLDSKWTTIDEVAHAAGMFTSGVSANGYVALKWGFGTAWDKYRNHIHEGGGLKGEDVYAKAIESVTGKTGPWFLYLGSIDTHVSWYPKDPWIAKYHPPYSGRFAKRFSGEDAGKGAALKITDAEIEWVRALYDSNVSYQDDLLGRLLTQLAEWGIADDTMVVVTADHGDEQWEDGRVGHGGSVREILIHVPLVIHYPPMIPAGSIVEGAEIIDILPTVADALGQKIDPEWQGESLIPLANGVGRGYPRMSMASQYEGTHAVRIGPWKMRAAGSNQPQVYNLVDQPDENSDRVSKNPIATRFLCDPFWLLRTYNSDWKKSRWGNAANVKPAFASDMGE